MRKVILAICLMPLLVGAQPAAKKPDVWAPLKYFLGSWTGTGEGEPGVSRVERQYQMVLNGKYIQVNHRSVYAPQAKNPKGETHEDIGYFSYDRARKAFVLRQFHIEGYVNQFTADPTPADGKVFVFTSEAIENIPAGWRARETYRILSANEFTETFELAEPGKDFQIYSTNRFKRKR